MKEKPICHKYADRIPDSDTSACDGLACRRVHECMRYIQDHPTGIAGIKELTWRFSISSTLLRDRFKAEFVPGKKPWEVPVDLAFPCAIQNELNEEDAAALVRNGVKYVVETSNMGCTADAIALLKKNRVLFAPGKAANAGGVAVSGLEMSQNAMHYFWSAEEVDSRLQTIMDSIHHECVAHGREDDGYIDYAKGANIAAFRKVADAMCDQGF